MSRRERGIKRTTGALSTPVRPGTQAQIIKRTYTFIFGQIEFIVLAHWLTAVRNSTGTARLVVYSRLLASHVAALCVLWENRRRYPQMVHV